MEALKEKGCRSTPLRRALLEILLEKKAPVSVGELLSVLLERGYFPNKTTVYRQLETLVASGVVDLLLLDPKEQLFELKQEHHHHFVCESCDHVTDLHSEAIESAFRVFENELEAKGFSIQKHELSFFGACRSCH